MPSKASRRFRGISPTDLANEASAGALVTVTAVPLAIGLAAVAGVPPVAGLLTCVWPLVVFAVLGSSPHLKIGLDASSAAMIAATIPLVAAADPTSVMPVAAALTGLTGLLVLAGGLLRLGVLADLLALPVLVGYTVGIAMSVIIGQLPRMLGYSVSADNDVAFLAEMLSNLDEIHVATFIVTSASLMLIWILRRHLPVVPAAAVVLAAGIAVSWLFDLSNYGVATLGVIPSGFPLPSVPDIPLSDWLELAGPAAGVAIVIAADSVITSRSFAARLGYHVDASKDLRGLGAANMASSLSGGVVASASYSRTAIADRAGSRSQLSGVMAAAFMALVLLLLTDVLSEAPVAVLSAIVVDAVARLIDRRDFARLARVRRPEVAIAILTGFGVLTLGLLPTIALAVLGSLVLALVDLLRAWSHGAEAPRHPRLGTFSSSSHSPPESRSFSWHGPLVFLNTGRFRHDVIRLAAADERPFATLTLDAHDVTMLDATGAAALAELESELHDRDVTLVTVGLAPEFDRRLRLSRKGAASKER